jgi:hypothetical protein
MRVILYLCSFYKITKEMIMAISTDKLIFTSEMLSDGSNVGSFIRAGDDGTLITHHQTGSLVAASVVYNTVTFTAVTAGKAGNSIVLVFNGTDDLDTVTGAWNTAHPTNTVGFSGQLGTYQPTAGTATLVGGSNYNEGLDVYILNDLTTSDNKAEDSQHTSGDMGSFILAVRHDADTSMVNNDGDYAPLVVDSLGRLKVTADFNVSTDYVYAEDSAAADGALGAYILSVRSDTLSSTTNNNGDMQSFKTDSVGSLWTRVSQSAAPDAPNTAILSTPITVGTSQVALPASPLAARKSMIIENLSNKPIYIGATGVLTTSGTKVNAGGSIEIAVGPSVIVYAIGEVASQDIRVLEIA